MPKPRLELPNIPASTVMDLRSEATLEDWHKASESISTYSRLHRTARVLLQLHSANDEEFEAMELGSTLAEALFHRRAVQSGDMRIDSPQVEKVVSGMISTLLDRDYVDATIDRALVRMETDAFETLTSYDRIAVAHVGSNEATLEKARRGAAVLHCALHDAAELSIQASAASKAVRSAGHLSLVP